MAKAQFLPVQQLQQRRSPLGGMLGQAAGTALGAGLGGPLGAQVGGALGSQLGGTGTINPMQAGTQVLGQNQGAMTDWMRGQMGFNSGGPVYRQEGSFLGDVFGRNMQSAMSPRSVYGLSDRGQDVKRHRDAVNTLTSQWKKPGADVMSLLDDYKRVQKDIINRDDYDSYKDYMKDLTKLARESNEYDAEKYQELKSRSKPRSLGGAQWDIPLGSIGDVDFSTQGQYGMVKGADDPYAVQLTGRYDWGGDDTPMAARRAGEMSMDEYNRSGPEAAAADAQLQQAMGGMSEKEKRLAALLNMNQGGKVTLDQTLDGTRKLLDMMWGKKKKKPEPEPEYKFLGGLLGAADKATRAADFVGGISKIFSDRNDKLKGGKKNQGGQPQKPKKEKLQHGTVHRQMGGPIGGGQFMGMHPQGMAEKVGPLAKTSYKSKGGEVWERSYHDPNKPKMAPAGKPSK